MYKTEPQKFLIFFIKKIGNVVKKLVHVHLYAQYKDKSVLVMFVDLILFFIVCFVVLYLSPLSLAIYIIMIGIEKHLKGR